MYQKLQILNLKFKFSCSPILLTLYPLALFTNDVCFGVATLKLYHVLPLVAYLFFPVVKIWTYVMIMMIMRMGGEMYQESSLLQENWKPPVMSADLESFDRAHAHSYKPAARCLRPIVAKLGNFMRITYETTTLHMQYVVQYTIQLLMLMQSKTKRSHCFYDSTGVLQAIYFVVT